MSIFDNLLESYLGRAG